MTAGHSLARLAYLAEESPTRWLAWLPIQVEFFEDQAREKLIRTGNQLFGKTTQLVREILRFAENEHPDPRMRDRPLRILAISISDPQSVEFQLKLWEMADQRLLDPRTGIDPVNGFKGRKPACRWLNGTIVLFKSGEAGPAAIAGETADVLLINEPTTYAMYREATRRVLIKGGYLIMGMTPINQKEPLDWLKDLCGAGVISEHHTDLTPESMIPVGHSKPRQLADGTVCDAQWIESQRKRFEGRDQIASIVLDGGWETPIEGQSFPGFDPRPGGVHIVDEVPPGLDLELHLGIDHGERDHKQVAVLVGLEQAGLYPCVWVLDEYVGEGLTLPEEDAAGILAMLGRWGWSWDDLKTALGDKPHDVRRVTRSVARKSNADLQVALARRLNRAPGRLSPPIRQAKRGRGGGRGSVDRGVTWLHTCMLREGGFHIHSGCSRGIESLSRWAWKDDEYKDWIDGLRYATWAPAMRTARILAHAPTLRVR